MNKVCQESHCNASRYSLTNDIYHIYRYKEYINTDTDDLNLLLVAVGISLTYIVGVETLANSCHHVKLPVFLVKTEHVRKMVGIKPKCSKSREYRASLFPQHGHFVCLTLDFSVSTTHSVKTCFKKQTKSFICTALVRKTSAVDMKGYTEKHPGSALAP